MITEPLLGYLADGLASDPQLLLGVEHVAGVDHRLVVAALERDRAAVDPAQQLALLQVRQIAPDRLGRHVEAPRQVGDVDRAAPAARGT